MTLPPEFRPMHVSGPFADSNGPICFRKKADGSFDYGFQAEARHCNPDGLIHGGMLVTFADQFMGRLVVAATKRRCATVTLNVEYLAPARAGQWIGGEGKVERSTRSLAFVSAVLSHNGHAVMTASGVWRLFAYYEAAAAR